MSSTPLCRYGSICVTGAAGRLGQYLLKTLARTDTTRIVAFDQASEPEALPLPVEFVRGDIQNTEELTQSLKGCELVIHLAGLVHVGQSLSAPRRYFETNVLGTVSTLDACRHAGVSRFIYVSSCHVYGKPLYQPVDEDHPTRPLSPYAASKLAGESAVQAYAASFGMACAVLRLSNLYGLPPEGETVVGLAMKQAMDGESILLRNLDSVRDFVHVHDAVEAIARVASALYACEGGNLLLNVATGRASSIREVAEGVVRIAARFRGQRVSVLEAGSGQDEEMPKLVLSNARLRAVTGWVPTIPLELGLEMMWQNHCRV